MNEYIEIRLFQDGRRLKVNRQLSGGIELHEPDPIERTVGLGFQARNEATRVRLDTIRRIQGWPPGRFDLRMAVEGGSLVLRGVNPHALPEGFYKLRLQIEEVNRTGGWYHASVPHDGRAEVNVEVVLDDRTVSVDLDGADDEIEGVLERSRIDGLDAPAWLKDSSRRPTRRACLLNLLASLRTRPRLDDPLIALVDRVVSVANDRIYTRVDKSLLDRLKTLSQDPSLPFYEEGPPNAPIHQLLFARMEEPPNVVADFDGLRSFRAEAPAGRPSLQAVVAVAPASLPYTYAEFDLDLANPLQDLVGFFVHVGELLDGKSTNHLDLWKKLKQTAARDFLYYTVS